MVRLDGIRNSRVPGRLLKVPSYKMVKAPRLASASAALCVDSRRDWSSTRVVSRLAAYWRVRGVSGSSFIKRDGSYAPASCLTGAKRLS